MSTIQTIQDKALALKNNRAFELFVVGVIIISALLVGAKTYAIPDGSRDLQRSCATTVILRLFDVLLNGA